MPMVIRVPGVVPELSCLYTPLMALLLAHTANCSGNTCSAVQVDWVRSVADRLHSQWLMNKGGVVALALPATITHRPSDAKKHHRFQFFSMMQV